MKYSRDRRNLHIDRITSLLMVDPSRSARSIYRCMHDNGFHLSRSYINQLVGDALTRLSEAEYKKRLNLDKHKKWQSEILALTNDLYQIKKRMDVLIWKYQDDIGID